VEVISGVKTGVKQKDIAPQRQLSVLLLNVQGIRTDLKYSLFEDFVCGLRVKPQIIAITEHWLNSDEVGAVAIKGYQQVANFARKTQKRGGVILFLSKSLKYDYVKQLKLMSRELKFENAGIEMKIAGQVLKIILVYRPSNPISNACMSNFFEDLESVLEENISVHGNIMLLGDFNIDLLKTDLNSEKLIEMVRGYNLKQENFQVTRPAGESVTLLDVIFSSYDCKGQSKIIKCPFSDHNAVSCEWNLHITQKRDTFKFARNFSEGNWKDFYEALEVETWEEVIFSQGDVNFKCEIFMDKLTSYFENSFPMKRVVNRVNQIGKVKLSSVTIEQKTRLRELGERIKREKDLNLRERLRFEFKSLKKYVGFCINNEVRSHNKERIAKASNKQGMMWRIIKETKDGNILACNDVKSLKVGDIVIEDPHQIGEILNEKFIETLPEFDCELGQEVEQTEDKFQLCMISEEQIFEILCKLPTKKSFGWDGISTEVLKKISLYIVMPLTYLVNCSFREGAFPDLMKISEIKPLYKKGSEVDASNYRPIALTSSIAKVFEKAFLIQLEKYYEENNFMPEQQHGFRKNRSTVTALFDMVTTVYESMNQREKINVVLYDFTNAFGSLVPDKLLCKLKMYGVSGKALEWVKSFLVDRKQLVKLRVLNDNLEEEVIKSKLRESNRGVPQGTSLGPFTYSAYSIDLPLIVVIATLVIFADDSTMIVKGKTASEVNEKTVVANSDMVKYSADNYLTLNSKKTVVMTMHTAQTKTVVQPKVVINDSDLAVVNSSRLLGVTITDTMNWNKQCSEIVSKLRSVTYLFIMLRGKVLESALLNAYHAYAESRILYSIAIWGGSSHMKDVFVAQKRVVRAMSGVQYWRSNTELEHCDVFFKKNRILTAYSLYILECVKFVKKFPEKFQTYREVPNAQVRSTRATPYIETDIFVRPSSLNCVNECPNRMMARIYNKLPNVIKQIPDYGNFVKSVKHILLHYCFYDMHEYWRCDFHDVYLTD
jgi:exonuclease III